MTENPRVGGSIPPLGTNLTDTQQFFFASVNIVVYVAYRARKY
jgi:hypothetical protein